MRTHYWSCSKFANWLRGSPKPHAATSEGWDEWERSASGFSPVRFWLAEEGLGKLQSFVYWIPDALYSIKYYAKNRWVRSTHALTASKQDIPPGQWRDVGDRFLPCLFNELVDFVEVELAWSNIVWDKEAAKKYNAPWWASGWFSWGEWRCPSAGLDNLAWQRALVWSENEVGDDADMIGKRTPQAERADEIFALYTWWTETYRNRPDPHEASGWSEVCRKNTELNGDKWTMSTHPSLKEESSKALAASNDIESQYEQEDEEMLIRLIKIRGSLWT